MESSNMEPILAWLLQSIRLKLQEIFRKHDIINISPELSLAFCLNFQYYPVVIIFFLLQNLGESFRIRYNPYSPPRLSLLASFFLSFFFQFLEDMRTTLRGWEWRWEQVNIGKKCGMKLMKHFHTFASLLSSVLLNLV